MVWTTPRYSNTRRTNAGVALAQDRESAEDLLVIDNWRSSHAAPLQVIKMLLKGRAKSVDASAIVAQRLKRLPSIRAKLQRESMRLPQMQDLGGCRAIVKDMTALRRLTEKFDQAFEKNPTERHGRIDKTDYIESPKADGYRSIHYVLSYQSKAAHMQSFRGHLIEVQIRTRMQHAWATAVEIVDTFTGQSLKSALKTNIGDPTWRRFFAVCGSVFADGEGSPTVAGAWESSQATIAELKELAQQTNVVHVLQGLSAAVNNTYSPDVTRAFSNFVLRLDAKERVVTISSFGREDQAQQYLFDEEQKVSSDPNIQIVQVSVEQMQALKAAYPNYYLDTSFFLGALAGSIDRLKRKRRQNIKRP